MIKLKTKTGSRKHPTWVAEITNTHAQYKFERKFINDYITEYDGKIYTLKNGIYEVCDGGYRKYIQVENESYKEITETELMDLIV